MTRIEALEILDHNWTRLVNPDYTDEELGKAQDMAIEALEHKRGEWIVQGGEVVCSKCFEPNLETNFCPNCGAKMDEREEQDAEIH